MKMKTYVKPCLLAIHFDYLPGALQGSIVELPIDCSGPSECIQSGESLSTGKMCVSANGSIYFRYYAPGNKESAPIECSFTINGQPLSQFCTDYGGATATWYCENGDIMIAIQCGRLGYTCTGNEDVVVSCDEFAPTICEPNDFS